jgi:hypothetical protein
LSTGTYLIRKTAAIIQTTPPPPVGQNSEREEKHFIVCVNKIKMKTEGNFFFV